MASSNAFEIRLNFGHGDGIGSAFGGAFMLVLIVQAAYYLAQIATTLALAAAAVVFIERQWLRRQLRRVERVRVQYGDAMQQAMRGGSNARLTLAGAPLRDRHVIARLLVTPLIEDRDPGRISDTRDVISAMGYMPEIEKLFSSWLWPRRALGLRVIGGLQLVEHTPVLLAALDDRWRYIRNTALDSLADLQNEAVLPTIAPHLLDKSVDVAHIAAFLSAFGQRGEALVLEMARKDHDRRLQYARALSFCGTASSRPALNVWATDFVPEVRVAALETLGTIGLDAESTTVAKAALDDREAAVRAAAARALRGAGDTETAMRVAAHLNDTWSVAVQAARTLKAMGGTGRIALESRARGTDLAGLLARQMLWEGRAS